MTIYVSEKLSGMHWDVSKVQITGFFFVLFSFSFVDILATKI